MTTPHTLTIHLGDAADLAWAQRTVAERHYLRQPVTVKARPMAYIIRHDDFRVGLIIISHPHAPLCRGWWGYPGLPTQWQVVDLCRIWLDPDIQRGGFWAVPGEVPGHIDRCGDFRPTVATWAIHQVLQLVQRDRVRLWPPVYPAQPYHILLAISYHDPLYHRGVIYRQAGAAAMYRDAAGQPAPGPSGKYGWCWRLAQPTWHWQELAGIRSRTMRMF